MERGASLLPSCHHMADEGRSHISHTHPCQQGHLHCAAQGAGPTFPSAAIAGGQGQLSHLLQVASCDGGHLWILMDLYYLSHVRPRVSCAELCLKDESDMFEEIQ